MCVVNAVQLHTLLVYLDRLVVTVAYTKMQKRREMLPRKWIRPEIARV